MKTSCRESPTLRRCHVGAGGGVCAPAEPGKALYAGALAQGQGAQVQLARLRPAEHRLGGNLLLEKHHLAHPRAHQAPEGVFVGGEGLTPLPAPLSKNFFSRKLDLVIDNHNFFAYT